MYFSLEVKRLEIYLLISLVPCLCSLITLPRNSEYSDEIFEEIKKIHFPNEISFNKISLIEQKGDRKWEILKNFKI